MNKEEDLALRQITEDMNALVKPQTLPEQLLKREKDAIQNALYETNGNRTLAAQKLGIGRTCLLAKMKKFDLF